MKKIWFNVSHNGNFIFCTRHEENEYRAGWTQAELVAKFPKADGFKVSRHEETTVRTEQEVFEQ